MDFIPATPAHYAGIAALIPDAQALYLVHPAGHFPWDAEQLERLARERSHLTVGLIDGRVQAFANLYQLVPERSAFLGNVVVAQGRRGQGLGEALVRHMLGVCDGLGVQPHLSVFASNSRALLLYRKLGFMPYEVEARLDLQGQRQALLHLRRPGWQQAPA